LGFRLAAGRVRQGIAAFDGGRQSADGREALSPRAGAAGVPKKMARGLLILLYDE
jgi:hypothetical protein